MQPNTHAPTTELKSAETERNVAQVRVEYTNIEDFLVDYTSNQTIGGMFIKTDRPMSVGTPFVLCFQLPGGRSPMMANAEVRWTLPKDVAAPMTPSSTIEMPRDFSLRRQRSAVAGVLA